MRRLIEGGAYSEAALIGVNTVIEVKEEFYICTILKVKQSNILYYSSKISENTIHGLNLQNYWPT